VVGVDEPQPAASVGEQPLERRRPGAQRRRAEQESLLFGLLVLVEQHDHQAGPAAEPAEQRALAHACGGRHVVHAHRVRAPFGDEVARGVEQQGTIAGGIASLLRRLLRQRRRGLRRGHALTLNQRDEIGL
jgi:hypothetical protein